MNSSQIRELAELMKDTDLTVIELSAGGSTIRLERGSNQPAPGVQPGRTADQAPGPAGGAPDYPEHNAEADVKTVNSPMVGVFYAAPSPGAKPFVAIGDTVRAGDVLCIIEAMKIMNEIAAESDGVITEVCVGDRQIVDYGHPLFRMKTL